ncbi:MAG: hypothetical protein UZ03_NOB001003596 [Nitrospira sp. OLB3]|nr:MAG: hypothetical protein UZ03_NOB001003596 [Nitrospira sp. OLB3]RIK61401.1 MAG: hypothetical protein DCC63_01290 [Nitrospira sp.]
MRIGAGILLFNPGSADPKRFHLPRVLGLLLLSSETIAFRHIELSDRAPSGRMIDILTYSEYSGAIVDCHA